MGDQIENRQTEKAEIVSFAVYESIALANFEIPLDFS